MNKLILIIEKSKIYSDYLKNLYLEEFNVPVGEVKEITELNKAGGVTLFGEAPPSVLTASNPPEVKKLVKDVENAVKSGEFEVYRENGLIIIANVNRVSTRKLEKLIGEEGGVIDFVPRGESITDRLLKSVSISHEVRQFLRDYVGENFENLIPLVKMLRTLSVKDQREYTVESAFLRLPKPPGAVPPWEVENALLRNDANKVIETLHRIDRNSSYLVILAMLKNKFVIAYRVAALLSQDSGLSDAELAKTLKIPNNFYFKKISEMARYQGLHGMTEIVSLLVNTEAEVKGRVNVSGVDQMEVALLRLNELFS